MSPKKTLLLIDGNSLFHRAYHALPPLTDRRGEPANAVYGFTNMLLKAIDEVKPTHIACAFDTRAPTFRHVEFEAYKATRAAAPADLYPQLPKLKKALDAYGINYFEKEGYEADDLIATIATKVGLKTNDESLKQSKKALVHSPSSFDIVILSGDRDVLQLVNGNIKIQMPGWNMKETTLYGRKEVIEKYGLKPEQMVDYKSLIGDSSDNVPGIAGIGPKTASGLLQKYGTLELLFKRLDEVGETVRQKLIAGKGAALAAKKLVELDRGVDIGLELEKLEFAPDWNKVRAEYDELGFKSIANKLPGQKVTEVSEDQKEPEEKNNQLELI